MAIKRILVPIDFSRDSLHALAYARDLSRAFHAELLLLHVVDQTYLAGVPELRVANPALAKLLDDQWQIAKTHVAHLGARLEKKGQRLQTLTKRGSPAQVIADTAKRTAADLIVMGTHGRTGITHMFLGSIAEKVVRTATCPVLTVRRAGGRRRAPRRLPRTSH
jgi:nucleotide-binding universal stress UspA family protein